MFNPKVPMFPANEQAKVVADSDAFIAMMKTSDTVQTWNLNRDVIKSYLKRTNYFHYLMLMGYIDNVVFPQMIKILGNGRKS